MKRKVLLVPESQNNTSKLQKVHLEHGLTKVSSHLLELQEGQDYTTSPSTSMKMLPRIQKNKKLKNSVSVTAESQATDKKMTCNDKLTLCNNNSQTTESSMTLDQVSISKEKVFEPFWNSVCQDNSNRLWCPIETDCAGLHSNCWNGSFITTMSNSWFSTQMWTPNKTQNLQKTCLQSLTFSTVESTDKGNTKPKRKLNKIKSSKQTKKPKANQCLKIRLKPNKETYHILLKWFGCCRKTYNWALEQIQKRDHPIDFRWLRNRFVNECNIPSTYRYLLDTPKHVREGAIDDLVNGFKLNFAKGEKFRMKFRSKKDNQSIVIPRDAIKNIDDIGIKLYPSYLKNRIKLNSKRCGSVNYDCRLVLDKLKRLYLCVSKFVPVHDNQMDNSSWVALDPGVRTFMTSYSPSPGTSFKYGVQGNVRLYRLCKHLDKLVSQRSKVKGRKLKRMKKAEQRLRYKIKHLVDDVHWKVIHHLKQNYDNIIIPPFEVKKMSIKRKSRVLSNKSVRSLYSWRHYTFRQRLIQSCDRIGSKVYVLPEDFTTKTCTICGTLNNVNSKKVIKCTGCAKAIDRDVNGARNIFLKNIKSIH